ncbi:hypothetical protein FisN_24Lu073 [Fistulifera solaris]|uniref:BTB domain-containing protein n=1 Tax=Fistulifera solaris TaxID=1519565 RepID=A0A1Z5K9G2_FISSO|nr:hypothetical protein FisN_24Lu073 [Fistulifera solaris]|eukprot:GAX22792.1 hypothetical protein FisN_24Lu073 [Fistulifera solaris]
MDHSNREKWRNDPTKSFSDWKIEIVVNDDSRCSRTYHVHKTFLAHGPRRSEYFAMLFHKEDYQEHQTNQSQIMLHPLAAETFPTFLDYVYGSKLTVTAETATALHHLAEYFQIRSLLSELLGFFAFDSPMSMENVHIYYLHAKYLCDVFVMGLVTSFLRTRIQAVLPTHPIVEHSDPQLWANVCRLDPKKWNVGATIDNSCKWSRIVAKVCTHQGEDTLDSESFQTLTTPLASIDPSVALDLCKLEDRLYCKSDNDEAPSCLSLLQERCVSALSEDWKGLNGSDVKQVENLMQRSPEFLVKLLIQSVKEASQEVDRLSFELDSCNKAVTETPTRRAEPAIAKVSGKRGRDEDDGEYQRYYWEVW